MPPMRYGAAALRANQDRYQLAGELAFEQGRGFAGLLVLHLDPLEPTGLLALPHEEIDVGAHGHAAHLVVERGVDERTNRRRSGGIDDRDDLTGALRRRRLCLGS